MKWNPSRTTATFAIAFFLIGAGGFRGGFKCAPRLATPKVRISKPRAKEEESHSNNYYNNYNTTTTTTTTRR